MRSKYLLVVALVLVLVASFAAFGYAYTASTVNSNNIATSHYVVLTQQNYNFTNTELSFDVGETEAGIVYRLNGTNEPLISIDGISYVGISIGTDKLTATANGFTPSQPLKVSVTSPQLDNSWFTDYSDYLMGWKYILKVTAAGKATQYAFYDGAEDGLWNVKGKVIESSYTVSEEDANKGGYISLYRTDGGGKFTVVKIGDTTEVLSNLSVGTEIGGLQGWYVDGTEITSGKYAVNADDADGGRVIVLYRNNVASGYTVVKIDSGTVTLLPNKTPGTTIDGVTGWMYGGGSKLDIVAGVEYGTELFFAGSGVFSDASLRSVQSNIKISASQVMIVPVWVPAVDSDLTKVVKYTLKAGTGGIGNDRIAYIVSGSDLILPENVFTNIDANKKFVGWRADDMDKIFTPWHIYPNNTQERTFTAQWANVGDCYTVTFDLNGGQGSMATRYILMNNESGNTFTLPHPEFSKSGYAFTGWTVTGASSRDYRDYTQHFTDIPAVKENIVAKAEWIEDPAGCEHVAIGNQENTVVKVASDGTVTMIRNLVDGDIVTGVDGWHVEDRTISTSYTVWSADAEASGYIVLYETANAAGQYDVILIDGDLITVKQNLSKDAEVDHVGGWKVKDAEVYGGIYYVRAADADNADSRFIVVYNETNPPDRYTVLKVASDETVTVIRNLVVGDTVEGVHNWHRQGTTIETTSYTVVADHATNGFIVLYQEANETGKYSVVKVDKNYAVVKKNLALNAPVSDVRGWKIIGDEVGTYTVKGSDAGPGGYIVLYQNSSFRYLEHTDSDGRYTLPYCAFAPPESIWKDGFEGWTLLGWSVTSDVGRIEPQALIVPYGVDGYIVKNGSIKFTYSSDLINESG